MSAVVRVCCDSCTEGSRQLILCLVRRIRQSWIAISDGLCSSLSLATAASSGFAGSEGGIAASELLPTEVDLTAVTVEVLTLVTATAVAAMGVAEMAEEEISAPNV